MGYNDTQQFFLGDLYDISSGLSKNKEQFGSGYPFLSFKTVFNYTIIPTGLKDLAQTTLSEQNKYSILYGDVFLTRTSETANELGMSSVALKDYPQATFNGFTKRLRPKKGVMEFIDPKFIAYYLRSKDFRNQIDSISVLTTRASLNQGMIEKLTITVPNIETQKKIAAILSALDEKIATNRAINDNLQQQAMSLYAEMFLNSSDSNVTSGTLSDIAVITMGQSPSGSSYNEDGVGEVFYQGRAEFGFRFPKRRLFTTEPKRMAEAGDVLLSVRAPVGDLNIAYERCCIGRGLGAIHSKTGHSSFVLYTMFALRSQLDIFNGEGTVFGSINRDALNAIPIDIPPVTEIDQFEVVAHPIDELIRANYEENCRLEAIRDSLLPKLMSGEIDISAVQP